MNRMQRLVEVVGDIAVKDGDVERLPELPVLKRRVVTNLIMRQWVRHPRVMAFLNPRSCERIYLYGKDPTCNELVEAIRILERLHGRRVLAANACPRSLELRVVGDPRVYVPRLTHRRAG